MKTEKAPDIKNKKPCNCGCKSGTYGSFNSYIVEALKKIKPEKKKPKKKEGQIFNKKK